MITPTIDELGAETKVCQLKTILREQQHIFRLNIPMHIAQAVL